jgi:histidine triad (HIT) family protein
VNDGKGASQSVPHVHIHVIPRYAGDARRTLRRLLWHLATLRLRRAATPARRAELEAAAAAIRGALGQGAAAPAGSAAGYG